MGAAALGETQKSGSLVDVPGGYMVVHKFADKGVVCGQTWAAMFLVVDHEGSHGHDAGVQRLSLQQAFFCRPCGTGGVRRPAWVRSGSQYRPSEVRKAAIAAYAASTDSSYVYCGSPHRRHTRRLHP